MHLDKPKSKGRFICDICGVEYTNYHLLSKHKKSSCKSTYSHTLTHIIVNKDGKFVCKICEMVYDRSESLKAHIRRRHMENTIVGGKFLCEDCGMEYSKSDSLLKHRRRVHKAYVRKK